MNSPSYYYQTVSQNQLNNEQFDKDSDRDRSMSQFSHEQHYPFYENKIIHQSNNFHKQQQQQCLKNPISNPNHKPSHINHNHSNHQQHQYPANHHMFYNQDRSLKVNKKSQQQLLINKNKSHSSPSNQPSDKKPFKKIKQTKQLHPLEKSKVTKYNFKTKKTKIQKQKKISNGSSSTANTKTVHMKVKKRKVENKKVEEKGHHGAKSSHNNSQQSNEFLILGDNLYDYQDLSRVTTAKQFYDNSNKLFSNELDKSRNRDKKKINVGEDDRQLQLSRKNNGSSFSIYDPAKLQKKVSKTISKIEKYMLGFIEAETFEAAKQETLEDTESLSMDEKLELYHQLMRDSQLAKELSAENKVKEENKIDDVIRLSIEKVEKKSQKLSQMYQQESGLISKWKNSKLHQLSTAKKILQRLMQTQNAHKQHNNKPNTQPMKTANNQNITGININTNINANGDLQQIEDIQQQDPLYLLEKQLQQVMNDEQYYPQMKKHTIMLRKSLNDLLKNQHFPQPKVVSQSEVVEKSRLQNTQNYFTPNGVLWFFDKFFTFITEKPKYIFQLVDKLNEGFGFDVQTKKVMAKQKNLQKWHDFFGEGETSVHHRPLLDELIFKRFQQKKSDPELGPQILQYMHYFNKAIIDSFNEEFHRFRPFYPNGEPLPFIQKPGKYFQITNESIFYFFEKAKYHIYTNYITFFAGLILPEGQSETKETKHYNAGKEVKLTNEQLLYDWEFYHCLLPVAKLATLDQLYQDIETQVFNQLSKDLLKTFKLKLK